MEKADRFLRLELVLDPVLPASGGRGGVLKRLRFLDVRRRGEGPCRLCP